MIHAFHCLGTETEDEREKQETGLTSIISPKKPHL